LNSKQKKTIYFITGASGVGKTTLVEQLKEKYKDFLWDFLHFDSVGVPSTEEMIEQFGSPQAWQEANTKKWIRKIVGDDEHEKIFIEGQADLNFIYNGFKDSGFTDFKVILLDTDKEEMTYRLTHLRNQPELLNEDMYNWLKYLRKQAVNFEIPIINTAKLTKRKVLSEFEKIIKK